MFCHLNFRKIQEEITTGQPSAEDDIHVWKDNVDQAT